MKVDYSLLVSLIILLFSLSVSAQKSCGAAYTFDANRALNYFTETNKFSFQSVTRTDSIVTIPTVVHVITRDNINISEDAIHNLIANTNELLIYKPKNLHQPMFKDIADIPLYQLCLITEDLQGKNFDGINYYRVSARNFADKINPDGLRRIFYNSLGGVSLWDREKVLNIYISESELHYGSSFVPYYSEHISEDGILLDVNTLLSDREKPTPRFHYVLAHELGHYFGLLHPWGLSANCIVDDGVKDTPRQGEIIFDCVEQMSCESLDQYANIMNYTLFECSDMFTIGQIDKLRKIHKDFRPHLGSEQLCRRNSYNDRQYFLSYFQNRITLNHYSDYTINGKIYITNMIGQLVHEQKIVAALPYYFDFVNLNTGMYLVTIKTEDTRQTLKIFIPN